MVTFLRLQLRPAPHFRQSPFLIRPPGKHIRVSVSVSCNAVSGGIVSDKPSICTADELHRVPVSGSNWRLALWRYKPSSSVNKNGLNRNHPLLLLSGVGTNAIGYDLAPGSSFARYMSLQGFDTWILELRGAGLSELFDQGLVPTGLKSGIASQVRDWSEKVANVVAEFQRLVGVQNGFSLPIKDFQQLDLGSKYDWDFDHYLEEDVPAAMDYIRKCCKPKDNKLLAIGHSMGGILLCAMLSQNVYLGKDSQLKSVVTLGSSLDYTTSGSSLKVLLPLADSLQSLSIPVIPLGAMMAAAYPLASRPPYFLSWLNSQISAQNMMHPDMLQKLVFKNFGTIPGKLLLQLATAFQEGGLCNRDKTFFYKDYLHKIKVPVLAIAGDVDLICPPQAVYETAKLIPKELITYKVFGEPDGPHYAHYDLVGGRLASNQVYPSIVEFLHHHDQITSDHVSYY